MGCSQASFISSASTAVSESQVKRRPPGQKFTKQERFKAMEKEPAKTTDIVEIDYNKLKKKPVEVIINPEKMSPKKVLK